MMDEAKPDKKENSKFEIIATIALVVLLVVSTGYLAMSFTRVEQQIEANENTGGYTSYYTNVTAEAAYNLINTTTNLTIIDCRGLEGCGQCQFKNGGHLEGATLNDNPTSLCNSTNDILVYSKDGTVGATFCENLVGHVYGKIYNLEGGFNAWTEKGYKIITGP